MDGTLNKPILGFRTWLALAESVTAAEKSLTLTSTDLPDGQRFAERFTANTWGCNGGNESPPLRCWIRLWISKDRVLLGTNDVLNREFTPLIEDRRKVRASNQKLIDVQRTWTWLFDPSIAVAGSSPKGASPSNDKQPGSAANVAGPRIRGWAG